MIRVLALVIAYVFVRFGTPVLLVVWVDWGWDGLDPWKVAGLIGLATYFYGVAALAVWYAVRPFPHGGPILAGLVSPAILVPLVWLGLSVAASTRESTEDRDRMAAAAELWEEWPSPPDVFSIPAVLGDTLLIEARAGFYESTDRGQSWSLVSERPAESGIELWKRMDGSLFAATSYRLYRSDDGGRTWAHLGVPDVEDGRVYWMQDGAPRRGSITALEVRGSELFLASGSVFRSDDLGESWTVTSEPRWRELRSMAVVGDTIMVGTFTAGLWRSIDGGASWSRLDGFPHPLIPALASHRGVLYAVGHYDDGSFPSTVEVLRSTDGGESWTAVNDGIVGDAKDFVGDVDGAMVLLATMGVFALEPNETTWNPVPYPGPSRADFPQVVGGRFGLSGGELFRLNPGHLFHFRGR